MNIELIRTLNAEHTLIIHYLEEVRERGHLDDEVRDILAKAKSTLTAHLDREEKQFYPVMRKAAENNETIGETLKIMGIEMDAISKKALTMLDAWISGPNDPAFADNFSALCGLLAERIKREEHSLYAKYLKLV